MPKIVATQQIQGILPVVNGGTGESIASGWVGLGACTYEAADSPTFQFSIAADVTGFIGVGNRIKLTQTTEKYFIVTEVGAFTAGKTILTVYGGTDYTLSNAAITLPYFSIVKAPFGFPLNAEKWDLVFSDNANTYSTAATVAATWYTLSFGGNPAQLVVPIGLWDMSYKGGFYITMSSGNAYLLTTLTSTNNAEISKKYSCAFYVTGILGLCSLTNQGNTVLQTVKTTWYLNTQSLFANCTAIQAYGSRSGIEIKAKCLYL